MNLANFQKPSRYIGGEINVIRKDATIKVALCFPDTYEIGMSHLGLKILYSIINNIPYASAERVFAPWIDYEEFLRGKGLYLASLENKMPLKDFDIIGFSLHYELSYTNVLNMLDLGGIPIRAEDRDDRHPLVIAGGPCATNPMPLIPFIDAFVIGDGEDVIKEIIEVYAKLKMQNLKCKIKEESLRALSELEGVYVPSIHQLNGAKIKRRIVEDLDNAPFPESPIVPFAPIVHDRVIIEIARGCTRGCRFCHAGMSCRPVRERSIKRILDIAQKSIASTGYEEVSFTSLSAGDYTCLYPLIKEFNRRFSGHRISISLPSLRVGSINKEILSEIKSVKKTGFTIAPEAGTKRLRDLINKEMEEGDYENALEKLFSAGWRKIKLYFMIGLPTETEEDIDEIVNMIEYASKTGKKLTGSNVNINVGVSAFVPKPHTPFQWLGQLPFQELRKRQDYLRNTLNRKGFNFKGQHVETSLLEAVLSRGDKTLASLIETAWRGGSRFDGWSETFNFDIWQKAGEKTGIDILNYPIKRFDMDDVLPWDIIETGVKKEFLKAEYQKSLKGEITADCKRICYRCGLECKPRVQIADCRLQISGAETLKSKIRNPKSEIKPPHIKLRVKFSKTAILRYLSHLEAVRAILRAIKRAGIPVAYTMGFHPHPKVSFGPALPVGIEGLNEYFDMEVYHSVDLSGIIVKMNAVLSEGLRIINASVITDKKESANGSIQRYEYEITTNGCASSRMHYIKHSIYNFMRNPQYIISREGRTVDIKQMLEKVEISECGIYLVLRDADNTKVRLYEMLKEMLQLSTDALYELNIKRTHILSDDENNPLSPPLRAMAFSKGGI